jgi:cation diffusion facilitator family transporter
MMMREIPERKARLYAISLSLGVGLMVMAVKFYAYRLTDSSALLSDALESIINVVASAFALWSILFSERPPDPSHPYGHGKVEYFSAGFEGALIIIAACGIFQTAWPRILNPQEIFHLDKGLILLALTGVVNLTLSLALIYVGRRTRSIVLTADGKHILTDVLTTLGVFVGLLCVRFTGYLWLDGVVAMIMAAVILYTGTRLVRQAFGGLMDEASPELLDEISTVLSKKRKDIWIDIHRLRAWRAGSQIRVDFHMVLPQNLELLQISHEIAEVKNALGIHYGGFVDVLVHTDPCNVRYCPACSVPRCNSRSAPSLYQELWRREKVIS